MAGMDKNEIIVKVLVGMDRNLYCYLIIIECIVYKD